MEDVLELPSSCMWSTGSICPSFLSHVIPPLRTQGCVTAVIFSAVDSDFSGWMHSVPLILLLVAAPWAAWDLHNSGALTLSTYPCSPQCLHWQTPPVAYSWTVFQEGHVLLLLQLPPLFLTETAHRIRDPHSLDLSYFHQGFTRHVLWDGHIHVQSLEIGSSAGPACPYEMPDAWKSQKTSQNTYRSREKSMACTDLAGHMAAPHGVG